MPFRLAFSAAMVVVAAASIVPSVAHAQADASDPLRRRAIWRASLAPLGGDSGVLVRRVDAGSPAARAGLAAGDRIVALNGIRLTRQEVGRARTRAYRGGDTVQALVHRRGAAGVDSARMQFVLEPLAREAIPGTTVEYGAIRSPRGYRVRTMVTRPVNAGTVRLPAVLLIPWLSCDAIDKPEPGADGMAIVLRDVSAMSGMLVMRVEKPGIGDSEGPDCGDTTFDDDFVAQRAALAALRARPDVDTTRIFLFGLSIGGGIAPILAADRPEGIAGVIAVGGFTRTWYEHMLDIERRRLTLSGQTPTAVNAAMRSFARFYTEYLIGRRTPAEVIAANPAFAPLWYDEPTRQYGRRASYYHDVQQLDIEAGWASIAARRIPALVVWGDYDWVMGRAEAERAVEIVNGINRGSATLEILPNTDHGLMTFASQAAAFADESPRYDGRPGRVISSWLRRQVGSARD